MGTSIYNAGCRSTNCVGFTKKRVLSKHDRLEEGKVVFRHPGH